MKLILVRHGESEDNKAKICQGQRDSPLSELGEEQAEKVAERLKDEKIDAIYSSDLKRARDTAEAINKYHYLEIIDDKRLRERSLGILQGKPFPKELDWINLHESIESEESMNNRVSSFIEQISQKEKGKTVLVSTHGGVKIMFVCGIRGISREELIEEQRFDNTGVSIFSFEDREFNEIVLNCTKHL